jgi:predicted enzyme related to lactoylglutathione lyase
MHGQFVWYELTTPDVDAAKKFYPAITGWGTQPFDNDYTVWTNAGTPFGGIFRLDDRMRQQGVPPNWMPYVETRNVDDTAKLAASLGGTILVPPTDIPGTGRFAVLKDPQGAAFGIYKSARNLQAWDGTPVLGRFSWHELMTTDMPKAFEFYRKLFGWENTGEMDMGGGNRYLMYGEGEEMYGGMFNRMPEMSAIPPFWLCYINVKDVKTAVAVATRGGAQLVRGPMDIPGGVIAILGDPQGAAFAVHHVSATAAQPAQAPKKSGAKKSAAKKTAAKKSTARKAATTRKAGKKRSAAKKAGARKAGAKKSSAKKAGAKKPAKRRVATKRTARRKR